MKTLWRQSVPVMGRVMKTSMRSLEVDKKWPTIEQLQEKKKEKF
jgi:hypothetical protein